MLRRTLVALMCSCALAACSAPSLPAQTSGSTSSTVSPTTNALAPLVNDSASVNRSFRDAQEVVAGRRGVVGLAVVDVQTGRTWHNDDALKVERSASVVKLAMAAYALKHKRDFKGSGLEYKLPLLISRSDNALMYELFDPRGMSVVKFLRAYDPAVEYSRWWGWTGVTARGQARFLAALAAGEVLNAQDTKYLLDLMRSVIPGQRWGWSDAYTTQEASYLPVKNGWYTWDNGTATINCLALLPWNGVPDRVAAAIVTSYPAELGLGYGRQTCRKVAAAFVRPASG